MFTVRETYLDKGVYRPKKKKIYVLFSLFVKPVNYHSKLESCISKSVTTGRYFGIMSNYLISEVSRMSSITDSVNVLCEKGKTIMTLIIIHYKLQ